MEKKVKRERERKGKKGKGWWGWSCQNAETQRIERKEGMNTWENVLFGKVNLQLDAENAKIACE